MRAVYLKNFRKGLATNSSSTHSVIYRNKEDMFEDLNVMELDFYDRYDSTIAASKSAKIKYVAANIFCYDRLFEIMCAIYPEMREYRQKAVEERNKRFNGQYDYEFGMACRGELYFDNSANLEASVDYLKTVIESEDIVIVGGSDETDFFYDTVEGHEALKTPSDLYLDYENKYLYKNGNYWLAYSKYDGKVRFTAKRSDECVPEYPELVDITITNKCEHGCPFCYMNSNKDGEHADFEFLKYVVRNLSDTYRTRYNKRVEFAIGGGNVLLYPQLKEFLELLKKNDHIVNLTIKASDCKRVTSDENLFEMFRKYVDGIGISVTSLSDVEEVHEFRAKFKGDDYKYINVHIIPELLGLEKTIELCEALASKKIYNILLLGYKTNGRGATQPHVRFTDEELKELYDERYLRIDTTFYNTYREWLEKHFETQYTATPNEGEYSMYIDGISQNAYKSSYQLDKPYHIGYGDNQEWLSVCKAFNKIREDNGLKAYTWKGL